MNDDIVARLRDLGDHASFEPAMHHKAADEIERLRARVRDLEQVEATAQLEGLGIDMHSAFNAGREALIKGCREERLRAEKAEAEIERLRAALREAREDILLRHNARGSEFEGTDEEVVSFIDAALVEEKTDDQNHVP